MATKLSSILSPILPSPGQLSPSLSSKFGRGGRWAGGDVGGSRENVSKENGDGDGEGDGEGDSGTAATAEEAAVAAAAADAEDRPAQQEGGENLSTLAKFTKGIQSLGASLSPSTGAKGNNNPQPFKVGDGEEDPEEEIVDIMALRSRTRILII